MQTKHSEPVPFLHRLEYKWCDFQDRWRERMNILTERSGSFLSNALIWLLVTFIIGALIFAEVSKRGFAG